MLLVDDKNVEICIINPNNGSETKINVKYIKNNEKNEINNN